MLYDIVLDKMYISFYVDKFYLKGKTATLFVGGGITADSDPEREWEETKNKCGTMLALL